MGDVIRIPLGQQVARSARISAIKELLVEAQVLIDAGESLDTVGKFLRTQMCDGPTEDIRQRAEQLLDLLEQRTPDHHTPETVA